MFMLSHPDQTQAALATQQQLLLLMQNHPAQTQAPLTAVKVLANVNAQTQAGEIIH
jgi:hypothetical protein